MAGFRIAVFGLVLASSCAVAQSAGRAELEEVLVTATDPPARYYSAATK